MSERPRYETIPEYSADEVATALDAADPAELLYVAVSVALYGEPTWAAKVCERLARHSNFNVRGNALLGFGHLARLHRGAGLSRPVVKALIEAGLRDADPYVRGQADAAADDLEHFLQWDISRPVA
jgi:hypothetical protein